MAQQVAQLGRAHRLVQEGEPGLLGLTAQPCVDVASDQAGGDLPSADLAHPAHRLDAIDAVPEPEVADDDVNRFFLPAQFAGAVRAVGQADLAAPGLQQQREAFATERIVLDHQHAQTCKSPS